MPIPNKKRGPPYRLPKFILPGITDYVSQSSSTVITPVITNDNPQNDTVQKTDVRIYVLCHTQERFNAASSIYGKYYWALPILMKYQDCTCENAFWKQLLEIKDEWFACDMVGTISFSASRKVNIDKIDRIIRDKSKWTSEYYHFWDTGQPLQNDYHPHIMEIVRDVCATVKCTIPTLAPCNYFMCSPTRMLQFIPWVIEILIPAVQAHPLAMTNSLYIGSVSPNECMEKWGVPYYPHVPFVLERLNKAFFSDENNILVFFVSHENTKTGAPIALLRLQKFLIKSNINTELLYLDDIKNLDFIKYVTSKTVRPIVICNTLVSYPIVKQLSKSTIPIIWYIHEWLDDKITHHYPYIFKDPSIFTLPNITLLFPCQKVIDKYRSCFKLTDKIQKMYNFCNISSTEKNRLMPIEFPFSDKIIISIIGSVVSNKNQQGFIDDVFYKINAKYPNVILVLVGALHQKILIKDKYKDSIIIVGAVANALPYINKSDIIVSYSINEVFPLNIIESMFCSKPVISTDVGGVTEMITDNETGFLINVNDYNACFNKLENLITDTELRNTIGKRAQQKFLQTFEENMVATPLLSYIKSLYI